MSCGSIDDLQASISRIDAALINNIAGNPILERKWSLVSVNGPRRGCEHGRATLRLHVRGDRFFQVAHALTRSAHEWYTEYGAVRFEFNYTTEMPITLYLKVIKEEGA